MTLALAIIISGFFGLILGYLAASMAHAASRDSDIVWPEHRIDEWREHDSRLN